jgi:hypothetical protein
MGRIIILCITFLTSLPYLGLTQTNGSKVTDEFNKQTNVDSLSVQKLGYDLRAVGDQWAEAAATWTAEEKEWFKSTFIIKRGCFRIPDNPNENG